MTIRHHDPELNGPGTGSGPAATKAALGMVEYAVDLYTTRARAPF
ncbi:hypothetical protein ACIGZJ_17380 [Kitasatospora sp. NPDC052868]